MRAEVIVQGRVVDVRYEPHPDYPHLSTVRVTLQAERMMLGPSGKYYTFRAFLPASMVRTRNLKHGEYQVGQRLFLFLPSPSQYGLSSPIAGEQSRFHIQLDSQGRELVANEFGNAGLFRDVNRKALEEGLSLSDNQLELTRVESGPVPLEDFAALVESFAQLPRIR